MNQMTAIAAVTLRGLLGRRRTILMVLLAALPVLVVLLVRITAGRFDAPGILDTLIVRSVLPLLALIFGVAALGSEIDDGTAVHLLAKPVPRWRIVVAKVAVAGGLTIVLGVASIVLTGLVAMAPPGTFLAFAVAGMLGGLAYVSLFVCLSTITSRSLVAGLAYVLVWEGALADVLEGTRILSIRQATLSLAEALGGFSTPSGPPLDPPVAAAVLAIAIGGGLALGTVRLAAYQLSGAD